MSADLWAYNLNKCDGHACPMNCDVCPLAEDDEEEQEIINARRGEE